jgi:hypothetical protein
MPELIISRRRRHVRCLLDHRHPAHGRELEAEPLTGPEPGRLNDLNLDLGASLVNGAHAVHGLRAEHEVMPQFADLGFRAPRDQANLSTAAGCYGTAR